MTGVESEKGIKTRRRISFVFFSIGAGYDRYGAVKAMQKGKQSSADRLLQYSVHWCIPFLLLSWYHMF